MENKAEYEASDDKIKLKITKLCLGVSWSDVELQKSVVVRLNCIWNIITYYCF